MTDEMKAFYYSLTNVEVSSINAAYEYVGKRLNEMDMTGTLPFVMSRDSLKLINKDIKLLKKYYKGRINLDPDSVYQKYKENTEEHFYLACVVQLMRNSEF